METQFMPNNLSPTALANRVQQLLDERQQHEEAIQQIDQTLEQIDGLLGLPKGTPAMHRKPGRKPKTASIEAPAPKPAKRRRGRGEYATTATESILAFVKQKGNPTTQEIRGLWKQEGRGGSADNVLTQLVKAEKLARTPMKDRRGSRYSLT
jgi:hypothetical protein